MENQGTSGRHAWFFDRRMQMTIDLIIMLVAYVFAWTLRDNFKITLLLKDLRWDIILFVLVCQMFALMAFGCYKLVWRYISIGDLPRLGYGVVASAGFFGICRLVVAVTNLPAVVPSSIIVLNAFLFFFGLCGARLSRRAMAEHAKRLEHGSFMGEQTEHAGHRVLLVGAGSAGNAVAKDLHINSPCTQVVGFLDDDSLKQESIIQGIPVLGKVRDLKERVLELGVDEVIVTMVSVSREIIRNVARACEEIPVPVRIIPGYFEIVTGAVNINRIRDVDIADLLGRDAVTLDEPELARFVSGRKIMITGAGGSIGTELARQVIRFGPAKLLLVERSEPALYEIHRELRNIRNDIDLVPLIADINDETRMAGILNQHKPHVILHAAAHKHVPMMELNPCEAIKNNTLATRRLGELALEAGVEKMVQISTDKAVNPSSIMGASKRLAELALQDLNRFDKTRFVAVRFGNVLGSAGSVVPLFREQIRNGGPVTITHPDMIRYFMTIPEASGLVLQAAAMAEGGEIFVLDMGQPVRIVDMAEEMIRLSGLKPHEDIAITFTGIRPGEKLFEELSTADEKAAKTKHPRIFIGKIAKASTEELEATLGHFRDLCAHEASGEEIRATISKAIPEAKLAGA